MLRFGFVAQKYIEIVGSGYKEFYDSIELAEHGTISGCFNLKRAVATHNAPL